MATRLRTVWDRGEAALNGWLSIPSTVTAEIVARQDYDSIVVDLQHGLIDYQMALTMMQAAGAASDATVLARPPWNEPGIVMKLLDAGERLAEIAQLEPGAARRRDRPQHSLEQRHSRRRNRVSRRRRPQQLSQAAVSTRLAIFLRVRPPGGRRRRCTRSPIGRAEASVAPRDATH